MGRRAAALVAFLLTTVVASSGGWVTPARAATGHVSTCSNSGAGSLPAVVVGAASGDTIVFDLDCAGASTITLTPTTGSLEIVDVLTIDGTGHAVTISGNDTTRIFHVESGATATLKSLTLTHGGGGDGAAIANDGSLTLQNSTISASNSNDFEGGGILNSGGSLSVQSSTFVGNSAPVAGGAISSEQGSLMIQDSSFSGNHTSQGGAIRLSGATMTVRRSTFSGNSSTGPGGAIYAQANSSVTLLNSTLTGNSAGENGGGLDLPTGSASLVNVTLSDNTAGNPGSAISNPLSTVTAANTIVSGTGTSRLCFSPATDNGNNLQAGDTSCGFSNNAVTGNPKLGPLASNGGPTQTRALGEGSPAIGAGSATVCQSANIGNVDQRGMPRQADTRGVCDIGAYDTGAGPPSGAKTIIDRNPDTITADGSSTATITVLAFDAGGNRLRMGGATVALQTTLGSLSAVTDNHDGSYTATLTAGTVSGNATVTGKINGNPITDVAGVDLEPGPPSGATTLVKSDKQRIPANGTSTATITVQAIDQYGNVIDVGGATVVLSTTLGSLGTVSYIGSGRYQATLTSSKTRGLATIHGTINGQPITSFATVRFR